MRTLIVIPTYNERENIVRLLSGIATQKLDVNVLVVDDSSPDGTATLVKEYVATHPWAHLLVRQKKEGLGAAYRAGFAWGLKHGYEAIITMDADHSHDPAALPRMIEALGYGVDLVLGSRRISGGAIVGWNLRRKLFSFGANFLSRSALKMPSKDVTTGYRAYRATLLHSIACHTVHSNGYAFQEEMLWRALQAGARVKEIPIIFADRTFGKSKLGFRDIVEFFYTLGRLVLRTRPAGITATLTGLGAFFLYAATAARTVFPGDSTEFLSVIAGNGVAHPPGYPLYSLLGHVIAWVPVGTLEFRVNILSAIFGALTIALVVLIIHRLTQNVFGAIFGGALLATVEAFWLYSLVAEVFTLHTLILGCIFLTTFKFLEHPTRGKVLLFGLLFGLGMSNHHTILLAGPPVLWAVMIRRRSIPRFFTTLVVSAAVFLIGLTPYFSIPLFARHDPLVNWDNAVNFKNLVRLFFRQDYGTLTLAPGVLPYTPHTYSLELFFRWLAGEWYGLMLLLGALGCFFLIKIKRAHTVALLLGALTLFGPFFFHIAAVPIAAVNQLGALQRFFIAPVFVLGILAGAGVAHLRRIKGVRAAALVMPLLLLFPLMKFDRLNLRHDTLFARVARAQLGAVPQDGVYLAVGDFPSMAADWWQTKGVRTDIAKVTVSKLSAAWYREQMQTRYPHLVPLITDSIRETLENFCKRYAADGRLFASAWLTHFEETREHCVPVQEGLLVRLYPKGVPIELEEYKSRHDAFWQTFEAAHPLPDSRTSNLRMRRLLELISEGRHRVAGFYLAGGKREWAEDEYAAASRISYDNTDSVYNLAVLKGEGGDAAGALTLLEEVLRRNQEHYWSYAAAAKYARVIGDEGRTEAYLEAFLSFKPTNAEREVADARAALVELRRTKR